MRLYAVFFDRYAGYGTDMNLFGIFSSKESAEDRRGEINQIYEASPCNEAFIEEFNLDEKCERIVACWQEESNPEKYYLKKVKSA